MFLKDIRKAMILASGIKFALDNDVKPDASLVRDCKAHLDAMFERRISIQSGEIRVPAKYAREYNELLDADGMLEVQYRRAVYIINAE